MSLTNTQLAWVQSEVGPSVTVDDLNARFERLGSVRDVVIEVIRERRNALLEKPLSATLTGVGQVDFKDNVKWADQRLKALAGMDDDPSTPGDDTVTGVEPFEEIMLVRSRRR